MKFVMSIGMLFVFAMLTHAQEATTEHVWTDKSGNYRLAADFIARNEQAVALQLKDKSLLIVEIEQLSALDKQYLIDLENVREKTLKESAKSKNAESQGQATWTLADGNKIYGSVVEHGRRLVQIRKRGGKIYVNDRRFDNLPKFYQSLIPSIMNHFEKHDQEDAITSEKQLKKWLVKQKQHSRDYTVEGVLLESYNGDIYGVPFFMFSEPDLESLKPGWEEWLTADDDAKYQAELALRLRVQAIIRQRNEVATFNLQKLHVQLEAYDAGLFDLWSVTMNPPQNRRGLPVQVIVPARNSAQAEQAALKRFPNMRVGSVAKVRRK